MYFIKFSILFQLETKAVRNLKQVRINLFGIFI